jgi:hypothetical protein
MISKEYLHTAQALLRITKSIADETIANRLMALAADYERRAWRADQAEGRARHSRRIAPVVEAAE